MNENEHPEDIQPEANPVPAEELHPEAQEAPSPLSAPIALEIRQKVIKALQDAKTSIPDHTGDVSFGGLHGDLECAIALLKPRG